jgi:hypothetical protein
MKGKVEYLVEWSGYVTNLHCPGIIFDLVCLCNLTSDLKDSITLIERQLLVLETPEGVIENHPVAIYVVFQRHSRRENRQEEQE